MIHVAAGDTRDFTVAFRDLPPGAENDACGGGLEARAVEEAFTIPNGGPRAPTTPEKVLGAGARV